MPNVSRINGLRPVKSLGSSSPTGVIETYAVLAADSTALFIGDIVKLSGTADANGVAAITRLTTITDSPLGVVVGFTPDYSNLNTPQYRLASTARNVLVSVAPTTVYEVQSSGATVLADIGLNAGPTYTAGSTVTGQSGMTLDIATKATTVTHPLKIVGVVQRPDADMADSSSWKLLVTLNTATYAGNTVGI
jgi:hypothetical protein